MFNFLSNLFGGGAAAMPASVGPNGFVPTPMPDPRIMFDPTLGKVVPGSLAPGMPKPGGAPVAPPMAQPYGGPDLPPLARGTPGGGAPAPEQPAATPLQSAIKNQFSNIGSGGEQPPPSAPNSMQGIGSGSAMIPLLDYIKQNGLPMPQMRTGGMF